METEEHQNPLQGRTAACIKDGDALKAEKKPVREETERKEWKGDMGFREGAAVVSRVDLKEAQDPREKGPERYHNIS